MNNIYIISQVAKALAFLLTIVAYQLKNKKSIIKTMMIANILDIVCYAYLNAFSGCLTKVMALARNEIVLLKSKYKKLNNNIVFCIVILAYIIVLVITYNNIYSILPLLASTIYFYFEYYGNALTLKKAAFYCFFLWLAYDIIIFSIVGVISNIVFIIATFIGIVRDKREEKEKTNNKTIDQI